MPRPNRDRYAVLDHGLVVVESLAGTEGGILRHSRRWSARDPQHQGKPTVQLFLGLMKAGETLPFEFPSLTLAVTAPQFVRDTWQEPGFPAVLQPVRGEPERDFYLPHYSRFEGLKPSVEALARGAPATAADALTLIEQEVYRARASRAQWRLSGIEGGYTHPHEFVRFFWKANLWQALGWVGQRLREEPELRAYAQAVDLVIKERWPTVHSAYRELTGVSLTRSEVKALRMALDNKITDPRVYDKVFAGE